MSIFICPLPRRSPLLVTQNSDLACLKWPWWDWSSSGAVRSWATLCLSRDTWSRILVNRWNRKNVLLFCFPAPWLWEVPGGGPGMTLGGKREKQWEKRKGWFNGGGGGGLAGEERVPGTGGSNKIGLSHLSAVGLAVVSTLYLQHSYHIYTDLLLVWICKSIF